MSRAMLALGCVAALLLATPGPRLGAAELRSPRVAHAHVRPPYCGPCGCLLITYGHHRELRSTYGLSFDPRNYDTTEPHYYLGRVRAYPRYSIYGVAVPGSC